MFNAQAYANSRHDGVAVLEIPEQPEIGQRRLFVPLKRTVVGGTVLGPLAEITVTHTYGYTKAQCDKVLEAVYRFPLPGDAAITKVVVSFGDVEIRADLKERRKAEAEYGEAQEQGRQAVLLTRESPDVFTLRVTGIRPDEDVTVETCYVQLAAAEGAGWALRIPLTTAPRYVRGDERTGKHAKEQPLLPMRDPGHRFALDLLMPGVGAVESGTHELEVSDEDGRTRVRLRNREVVPDRDCVIAWRPQQERERPSLHVLLSKDEASGHTYFIALVAPPAVHDPAQTVPREAIVLVDHSGSMEGPKWQAADWAVLKLLGDLSEQDRVNVGVFHTRTRWHSQAPYQAGQGAVADAGRFLKAEPDGGGTELGVALEQALRQRREAGERSRQVLIVTDAQVSDFARILRLVDEEARERERRRVSVICVDAAPSSFLVLEMAKRGGGIAAFLTSAPGEGDITTALDGILSGWNQPILTGLRLEVNRPAVEAPEREVLAGSEAGWSGVDLGDLPAGRAIWVAGRVATGDAGNLAFRLTGPDNREIEAWRTKTAGVNDGALKALFGAWRVLGLESLMYSARSGHDLREVLARLGYDPEQVLAGVATGRRLVYHENVREENTSLLEGLLVREALDYGLLCSATGFVAVRKESGKRVEETVLVSNALPAGWSGEFLAQTASMAASPLPSAVMPRAAMPGIIARMQRSPLSPKRLIGRPSMPRPTDSPLLAAWRLSEWIGAPLTLHSGALPPFAGGEAVLFDTARRPDARKLGSGVTFSALRLRFPDGTPEPESVDPELALLVFVGDMAMPAVHVRLVDMLRQGGERPVSIARWADERVRVVLSDPAGAWAKHAPRIEVTLE